MDVGPTKGVMKEKQKVEKSKGSGAGIVFIAIHPTQHVLYTDSLLSFTRYGDGVYTYPSFQHSYLPPYYVSPAYGREYYPSIPFIIQLAFATYHNFSKIHSGLSPLVSPPLPCALHYISSASRPSFNPSHQPISSPSYPLAHNRSPSECRLPPHTLSLPL